MAFPVNIILKNNEVLTTSLFFIVYRFWSIDIIFINWRGVAVVTRIYNFEVLTRVVLLPPLQQYFDKVSLKNLLLKKIFYISLNL